MIPNINLVEVHSQMKNNRHPMDGALVGVGSFMAMKMDYPHLKVVKANHRLVKT